MNKKFLRLLVLCVLVAHFVSAQDLKRIRRDDLVVRPSSRVESSTNGHLRFSYRFENSLESHQSMSILAVQLDDEWIEDGGTMKNVVAPSEKDWGQFPSVGEKLRWCAQYDTTGLDILVPFQLRFLVF